MKILFFGDSVTDAYRSRDFDKEHLYALGYGYVNQCVTALMQEAPFAHTFVNKGIGGNRVVDLYARLKVDVWNEEPDLISILVGVNDATHDFRENPNGVEVERYESVYRMLIEDTLNKLPNIKIILLEPFFLHGEATDYQNRYEHFTTVTQYAEVTKRLAKEFNLPFVALQDKFNEAAEKYGDDKVLADGVHPNAFGARLIANEWLSVFKKEI